MAASFSITSGTSISTTNTISAWDNSTASATTSATDTYYIAQTGSNVIRVMRDRIDEARLDHDKRKIQHLLDAAERKYRALSREGVYTLPNGSVLSIDSDGNYVLDDKKAKTLYKGHTLREFNKYLNASDLVEEFIRFCGTLGVRKGEFLKLPIEQFIMWLVIQAAEQDEEDVPHQEVLALKREVKALPGRIEVPRCLGCGRFMEKKKIKLGINFCQPEHLTLYERRVLTT